MTEEAKAARAEYLRNWRKKNRDKLAANQEAYWERVAARKMQEARKAGEKHNEKETD